MSLDYNFIDELLNEMQTDYSIPKFQPMQFRELTLFMNKVCKHLHLEYNLVYNITFKTISIWQVENSFFFDELEGFSENVRLSHELNMFHIAKDLFIKLITPDQRQKILQFLDTEISKLTKSHIQGLLGRKND